jgi:hypothetical protein
VTFTFARKTRKAGKPKLVASGTLTLNGHKGTNTVAFEGRISRKRRLSPGTYRVTAVASSSGVNSKPRSLTFAIVR